MKRQMYRWRSNAVRQYGQGHLIAMGTTPDEARVRVRIHARAWIKSENGRPHLDERDDDDRAELATFFEALDADLSTTPDVGEALVIWGSE